MSPPHHQEDPVTGTPTTSDPRPAPGVPVVPPLAHGPEESRRSAMSALRSSLLQMHARDPEEVAFDDFRGADAVRCEPTTVAHWHALEAYLCPVDDGRVTIGSSPLLAAIYLLPLVEWARKEKIDYVRYMDDIVILTKKRHQLRRAVKKVYSIIEELGLKLAPAKTWLGRVTVMQIQNLFT